MRGVRERYHDATINYGATPVPQEQFPSRSVGLFHGLSFKQAVATLVIALGLGLAAGGWELMSEYRDLRRQVEATTTANLALVRGLAVEAAFMLSSDLAGEVVGGLMQDPLVAEVVLADNFGSVLSRLARPPERAAFPRLAQRLFGDMAHHSLVLKTRQKGVDGDVGRLELRLDDSRLLERYLGRMADSAAAGAARTVLLCLLVVAVFYGLITKPLLSISGAIAGVDPKHPGRFLLDTPGGHQGDELGLLVHDVNSLLAESQRGLSERDRAEAELAALARDLERRVQDRTAELEKTNRFISDGIRYASRIQTALLPDPSALDDVMAEMVVGWHPFDIVGGDYYWTGRFDDKAVVAVMDCTGHGVPGAFMTAVVSSILARILHHHGHDDPAVILGLMNFLVKSALRQDRPDAPANDGLDAAICVVDIKARRLRFAGANLPLLVGSGGEIRVIRGDRCSLGYRDSPSDTVFTAHELNLAEGDTIYLFTDGLVDQVGGPHRRLFGRRRMLEVLTANAHLSLAGQKDALFTELAHWRGEQAMRDDMTFVAFRPKV